jgi:hypothetical protein
MSFKGDIQATRFNAATSNVIIAPAVRLRGIIIAWMEQHQVLLF